MRRFASIVLAFGFLLASHNSSYAQTSVPTPSPTPHHLFVTDATTPQIIPSHFSKDGVLVQGTINGHNFWFLLDSGTNSLAISPRAAATAGISENGSRRFVTDMDVGALHAHNCRFGRMKGEWVRPDGTVITGLIGSAFFRSNVVMLDFQKHEVVVYPNGSFDASKIHGSAIDIGFIDQLPLVHVMFGDRRATMLFDTGDDRTLLFQSFAKDAVVGPSLSGLGVGASFFVNSPSIPGQEFQTKPISLGNFRFNMTRILIVDNEPVWMKTMFLDGLVGRDVFEAFRVTFDYAHDVVYLER
ncbi:MAG TPA: retropepsin-like aspartic protease [Candidatus Baltobacteraceae bacterium]|jgi:hypothetical protein